MIDPDAPIPLETRTVVTDPDASSFRYFIPTLQGCLKNTEHTNKHFKGVGRMK